MDCRNCGYHWADRNEEGKLISLPYCHYEGPDEWAPCAQDDYLKNTKRGWPPKLRENLKKSLERNTGRLMTITRYNLPKCNRCNYWGWCDTIPQECPKGAVNGRS